VRIWDANSGRLVDSLVLGSPGTGAVVSSADGSWLAAGGDRTIRLWDVDTGTLRQELTGHLDSVAVLATDADGQRLVSGSRDCTVRIWDATTASWSRWEPPATQLGAVSWVTNGTWFATADDDSAVRIWGAGAGTVVRAISLPEGLARADMSMRSLSASPFARRRLGRYGRWRERGRVVATARGVPWIAAVTRSNETQIWDTAAGTLRHTLREDTSSVWALAAAPDGSWLATVAEYGEIRIWDPDSGALRHSIDRGEHHIDATVDPGSTSLAWSGNDGAVSILDVTSGTIAHTLADPRLENRDVDRPNVVFVGSGLLAAATDDGEIMIWDVTTGTLRHRVGSGEYGAVLLAAAADGSWLASCGPTPDVRLWNPESGDLRRVLRGHTSMVNALVSLPDGDLLASVDEGGTVRIWDTTRGQAVTAIRLSQPLDDIVPVNTEHLVAVGSFGRYFLRLRHPIQEIDSSTPTA
jgi:WD40 repeat protein